MTPEMPRVPAVDPNEADRPTMAEVAEEVRRSDGALLEAILATGATRHEIQEALVVAAGGARELGPRAQEVCRLLAEHDRRTTPTG